MAKVLIVDDEKSIRSTLREILEYEKFEVEEATDGLEALVKVKRNSFDVIILDIKMPKMDGMETLDRIQAITPDTPVLMISGHATIDTAVEAVKEGAFDFISKPPDLNRLLITLRNALEQKDLKNETTTLRKKIKSSVTGELIGESDAIKQIKETVDRVAATDARVLITGPNGSGKELVAHRLHRKSERAENPFVEVNCAAIPGELIESELFGHEKGAFTSAVKQRIGKFEQANHGTLFLDEIGDMSLSAQAKVLRALQENKISRVGGDKSISVNVRVIAATNKDLRKEIRRNKFREDLYHRLAVILINVPPLKDRIDDIPLLINHFNEIICNEYGIKLKNFKKDALNMLTTMNWSGNVRELRNVVERLIILSEKSIGIKEVSNYVHPSTSAPSRFKELFDKFDDIREVKKYIEKEYKVYREG